MAVLTVQVGQCGNQLGNKFFENLARECGSPSIQQSSKADSDFRNEAINTFFHQKSDNSIEARAVLLDMENKVVKKACSNAAKGKLWNYPQNATFTGTKGSGNNWAHGYCVAGPICVDEIMNTIQTQVEKCAALSGFIMPMSLAGGTGSGLGSFLTEKIKQTYPSSFVVNQVICPFDEGEVVVQNYNSVLTLSHIYQESDMIIFQENSNLQRISQEKLGIRKPSLIDLNDVAVHQMCNMMLPCHHNGLSTSIGDVIRTLCSVPDLKLVTISCSPQESLQVRKFSSYNWDSLIKYTKQMIISRSHATEDAESKKTVQILKSLTNLLILRGKDLNDSVKMTKVLTSDNLYSSNYNFVPPLNVWTHQRPVMNYDKLVTLVSNSQLPLSRLDEIVQKSWNMFNCKAYVHQYERCSLTTDEFTEAFLSMEQIIHNYKNLSS